MTRNTRSQHHQSHQSRKTTARDAIRLSLALVFILFASIASREHDSPETRLEAQEVALSQVQVKHPRVHEEKHTSKLPDASVFSRINGSI